MHASKIIIFHWDECFFLTFPNTVYMRMHISELESCYFIRLKQLAWLEEVPICVETAGVKPHQYACLWEMSSLRKQYIHKTLFSILGTLLQTEAN